MTGKDKQKLVIGVDGGGTKTVVALADSTGRILRTIKIGPTSPRNVGIEKTVENVSLAIRQILKNKKNTEIAAIFIGLPAMAEEFKSKKGVIKEKLLTKVADIPIRKKKVVVDSDQLAAFRSGTNEADGIVLVAGTGCVARGWRGKKDARSSGFGWLADEGSAFWAGQKFFQAVLKSFDGRSSDKLLAKKIFKELHTKNSWDLMNFIYSKNPTLVIPIFSIVCDKLSKQGNSIAKEIMREAGRELALAANTVIKKLNFQKEKFPLVLVGGMFKSKILLDTVKKEVKKAAHRVEFIHPKAEPVTGAVKLAIDDLGIIHH